MTEHPKSLEGSLVPLNVRIPRGLRDQLKARCEESGMSISTAMRVAIHQFLDGQTAPLSQRPHSDLVTAVGHMETVARAIGGLAAIIKK
jgi:antitoxin component of RelBE/YafQ-DinJ toxin-antitoxin module